MSRITDEDVIRFVAECAESIVEDWHDEDGEYTEEEFRDLYDQSMDLIYRMKLDRITILSQNLEGTLRWTGF